MTMLILDKYVEEQIIADRQAKGHDAHDEVWNGVYVVMPIRDIEHQEIRTDLGCILDREMGMKGQADVILGVNVSDRDQDWEQNYRCPDLVVFLPDTKAILRDAHSFGGPDFVVEIASEHDRCWDKVDFYAKVKTKELLIIDRNPWQITLLRLTDVEMKEVGVSTSQVQEELRSEVIPFSFRMVAQFTWPAIEIKNLSTGEISYSPQDPPLQKSPL